MAYSLSRTKAIESIAMDPEDVGELRVVDAATLGNTLTSPATGRP